MYKTTITGKTYDEERALYGVHDTCAVNCRFDGPADGESAFKETRNICADSCEFNLRYPFWHTHTFEIKNSSMSGTCRAALWYSSDGTVTNSKLHGIKCLRESKNVLISDSSIDSEEFGWRCDGINISNCDGNSMYMFFESKNVTIDNFRMTGKYSFQYNENLKISNSVLDTKDAFWHCKNAVIKDSIIKGEYLGWYSENLTFINCKISGTQPLCYCKNLKLINCTMENTDLSFEYSDVDADIKGTIISVKNPCSGRIVADGYGEIIIADAVYPNTCEIISRK